MKILIPCSEKDIIRLPLVFESLYENVVDAISDYIVVCPEVKSDILICLQRSSKITVVNENDFVGFGPDKLEAKFGGFKGWYYQQLIKLKGMDEDYIAYDADHVLLKPHRFKDGEKFVYYVSKEYHLPYFVTISRLLGEGFSKKLPFSFISDKMIFSSVLLTQMKEKIEQVTGKGWIDAIIQNTDYGMSNFSEFELYGTFVYTINPNKMKFFRDFRLMCFDKEALKMTYHDLKKKYGDNCLSLTYYGGIK